MEPGLDLIDCDGQKFPLQSDVLCSLGYSYHAYFIQPVLLSAPSLATSACLKLQLLHSLQDASGKQYHDWFSWLFALIDMALRYCVVLCRSN